MGQDPLGGFRKVEQDAVDAVERGARHQPQVELCHAGLCRAVYSALPRCSDAAPASATRALSAARANTGRAWALTGMASLWRAMVKGS